MSVPLVFTAHQEALWFFEFRVFENEIEENIFAVFNSHFFLVIVLNIDMLVTKQEHEN